MDVREKLVELLRNAKAAMKSENLSCDIARNMFVVDFMMANGVTVQEWISVKDRLPEEEARVLVYLDSNRSYTKTDTDRLINSKWVRWGRDVTHWMPLPDPPKGE